MRGFEQVLSGVDFDDLSQVFFLERCCKPGQTRYAHPGTPRPTNTYRLENPLAGSRVTRPCLPHVSPNAWTMHRYENT